MVHDPNDQAIRQAFSTLNLPLQDSLPAAAPKPCHHQSSVQRVSGSSALDSMPDVNNH